MRTLMGAFAALLTAAMISLGVATAHDGNAAHDAAHAKECRDSGGLVIGEAQCLEYAAYTPHVEAASANAPRAYAAQHQADGTYVVLYGPRKGYRYRIDAAGEREWIEVSSD